MAILLFAGCSSTEELEYISTQKFSRIPIVYNSNYNAIIGNELHVKSLGDISMFLHEYGHILHFLHLKPHTELIEVLSKEYPIPPEIIPVYENRELQDFITTTTRWKVKYPFKHREDILIVEELMANLFVIFTLGGESKQYVEENFEEIYKEYSIYYNNLDIKGRNYKF